MSNGNQQRCCILGLCCPPGSAAQRAAFKAWLMEKIETITEDSRPGKDDSEMVDAWLDELPWKKD